MTDQHKFRQAARILEEAADACDVILEDLEANESVQEYVDIGLEKVRKAIWTLRDTAEKP